MAYDMEIVQSLDSSMSYVKESFRISGTAPLNEFDVCVWHAAAELEYALFLFSLKIQDENVTKGWKPNRSRRKDDAATLLKAAQEVLSRSQESVCAEEWLKAYRDAFGARHLLLWVQKDLAKKRRGSFKK
jgi:hypothetical protein